MKFMYQTIPAIAAALFLAGCTATIDRPRPAPTPAVVYVRDEAAIADARVDGASQMILVSAVGGVVALGLGSLAYAAMHTRHERHDQPQHPAQSAAPVTYITHNHLHVHGARTAAQAAVRKMLDEVK